MAYPDYATFVTREASEVAAAYQARHHTKPRPQDCYHHAWRRLDERWTHADIVRDVLGQPLQDGGPGGDRDDPVPAPSPLGPDPPPLVKPFGVVRPYGQRSLEDDGGPQLHLTLSDFSLLRLYRDDRSAVRQRLSDHVARGFTAARCFGQVDWAAGKAIDPSWPTYDRLVADLTADAYAAGLRLEWTLIGGGGAMTSQATRRAYVRRMAQILSPVASGVLFLEMVNEPAARGLSVDDLGELVDECRAAATWPVLLSPGVVTGDEMRRDWSGARYLWTQHLDRDTSKSELQDRPWRQAWEPGLEGRRWVDNEPIGHGSTVNSETRPQVLRSHRLVSYISRACTSCLHGTPAGVYADVPWTDIPAYHTAGQARRFLPANLAEGQLHNANPNFPGRPFDVDAADIRSLNGNTRGLVRVYTCEVDGVCYTVPFGLLSEVTLTARAGMTVAAYAQDTNAQLWERQLQSGEPLRLPPAPDYLLVCRR